jgi:hypothetical protein
MKAGKITLVVVGGLGALLAAGLVASGAFLLHANETRPDAAGYFTTDVHRLDTTTHALVSEDIDLDGEANGLYDHTPVANVRVSGLSVDPDKDVFIGIARTADVYEYLAGAAWDEVTDFEVDPFRIETDRHDGSLQPAAPASQPIWAASAQGHGEQTLEWDVHPGDWSIVLMNADGSAGVASDVELGARITFLFWLGLGVILGGLVLLLGSGALMYLGVRERPTGPRAAAPQAI